MDLFSATSSISSSNVSANVNLKQSWNRIFSQLSVTRKPRSLIDGEFICHDWVPLRQQVFKKKFKKMETHRRPTHAYIWQHIKLTGLLHWEMVNFHFGNKHQTAKKMSLTSKPKLFLKISKGIFIWQNTCQYANMSEGFFNYSYFQMTSSHWLQQKVRVAGDSSWTLVSDNHLAFYRNHF